MSAIAIITARGGSKRIPKKNIKLFNGKPIISYSINVAIKSQVFDEIMVSTDDEEIAKIAISYGANVPFMRSPDTSNDYASTSDVLLEVVEQYKNQGREFDYICCIYPTAPFITPDKIIEAYSLVQNANINTVLPVVKYSYPPQRSFEIHDGNLFYSFPEYVNARSQDLPSIYHDAGQFYFLNTRIFLKNKTLIGRCSKPIIVSELEVQDIDNIEDWKIAEMKYQYLYKKELRDDN